MEVLYGIIVLIAFILGLGIGVSIPFFIKKYAESIIRENTVKTVANNDIENKTENSENTQNKFEFIPKDLIDEWMTGEVKPNDK